MFPCKCKDCPKNMGRRRYSTCSYQMIFIILHGKGTTSNEACVADAPVRRVVRIKLGQVKKAQGRPKKTWIGGNTARYRG